MSTLPNILPPSDSIAVIIPDKSDPVVLTHEQLHRQCANFRKKLSDLGIDTGAAVSIAIPNGLEFIVGNHNFLHEIDMLTSSNRSPFWL